jgi:hypothetical protein
MPICLRLLMQLILCLPLCKTGTSAGKSSTKRTANVAMTTIASVRVIAAVRLFAERSFMIV